MNNYIFAICKGNKNKLHPVVANTYEDAIEKAKQEIDRFLNLDDETYNILDQNDDWVTIRYELQEKGIYVTHLKELEEMFNL